MKANELRIGNLVGFPSGVKYKVDMLYSNYEGLDYWQPIPLTEEWLFKFGFEKLTDKSRGFNSNSYTYTKGISFIVHLNDKLLSVNFWQGNEKKYVHELQNLFFALTGEELTIYTKSKLRKMFGKQK